MSIEERKELNEMVNGQAKLNVDQYLTFILNDEEYGLDILSVVEIRKWEKSTPLPSSPNYIEGVINLRGNIVPIIDLRQKFLMEKIEYTASTVVIVLQSFSGTNKNMKGIVVDAVSDVYTIAQKDISNTEDFANAVGKEYINGLVTIKEEESKKMLIILDVNQLLEIQAV